MNKVISEFVSLQEKISLLDREEPGEVRSSWRLGSERDRGQATGSEDGLHTLILHGLARDWMEQVSCQDWTVTVN